MHDPVVGHQQQYSRRRGHARQRARKHAHHRANIDQPRPAGAFPPPLESTLSGAALWSSVPATPESRALRRRPPAMKNSPEKITLCSTARGIFRSGCFASSPSVVALSNPTKLNIARTMPSRTPEKFTPRASAAPDRSAARRCHSSSTNTQADQQNGNHFDIDHQARRNFHVAVGDPDGNRGREHGQRYAGTPTCQKLSRAPRSRNERIRPPRMRPWPHTRAAAPKPPRFRAPAAATIVV